MESLKQYRRMLPFLRPYARSFGVLFGLGFISTIVTLAQPYLTKLLIDQGLLRRDIRGLWILAAWMAAAGALSFLLGILTTRWYTRLSASVLFDMRSYAFRLLLAVSPQYLLRIKTGDIVARLNGDIAELQRLSSDTLLAFPTNALFLIGSAAMMTYLSWKLSLISLALLPVSIWAMRRYQNTLRDQVQDIRQRSSGIGSFLIESLQSMRLIVGLNAQRQKALEFQERNSGFVTSLLRLQTTSFLAGALPGAVITLATALLFLLGGSMVIRGVLTIGSLMAFMAYYSRLLSPVQGFMASYSALVTGSVALNRVFELLDLKIDVQEPLAPRPLIGGVGHVRFDNVRFHYDRDQVLKDVSFELHSRSINALVGRSGAGKSTIADLMLRFYDPLAGSITLDGIDLRHLSFSGLRGAVGMVEQTPFLFHASVRENLLLAAPEARDEDLDHAAQLAGIREFIHSMPEGYETVVGERGLALSAGQRQRIAIARALLRKPSVLVLDEPSSALDSEAEQSLAETLRGLRRHCTVLLITHRPALGEIADWTIALEAGRILERVAGNA